jgi:hypothetical protein
VAELIFYAIPALVLLLVVSIRSFRPTRVAFHEFIDLARGVRGAAGWRERLGYVFRGPGWSPDGSEGGTRG